jgi:gas vesicle protein
MYANVITKHGRYVFSLGLGPLLLCFSCLVSCSKGKSIKDIANEASQAVKTAAEQGKDLGNSGVSLVKQTASDSAAAVKQAGSDVAQPVRQGATDIKNTAENVTQPLSDAAAKIDPGNSSTTSSPESSTPTASPSTSTTASTTPSTTASTTPVSSSPAATTPSYKISINGGDATAYTSSVNLTLEGSDAQEMYITNSANCSDQGVWETFASSKKWTLGQSATLPSAPTVATVYVKYRNGTKESSCISDTIAEINPYVFSSAVDTEVTNVTVDASFFTAHNFTINDIASAGFTIKPNVEVTWRDSSDTAITGPITIEGNKPLLSTDLSTKKSLFGRINVAGLLNNSGTLVNNGVISDNGTINNKGTFTSYGYISNSGTLTLVAGSTLNNYATFNNYFNINNAGTIAHFSPAKFYSTNNVRNTGGTIAWASGSAYSSNGTTFTTISSSPTNNFPSASGGLTVPLLLDANSIALSGGTFTPAQCSGGFIVATGTVMVKSNVTSDTVSVASGTTLQINADTAFTSTSQLSNNGTITNQGTLNVVRTLSNAGTLTNNGTMALKIGAVVRSATIATSSFPASTLPGTGGIYSGSGTVVQYN